MIQKPLESIAKADIDALVTDRVAEIKTLEYKRELPGNANEERKKFLALVSAFANASGGDIIYGINPASSSDGIKNGEPESIRPIEECNPDAAKLRLASMIRDGIAPRLNVDMREVFGWNSDGRGYVLVVRVSKSFAAPHMVTLDGTSRFYGRNSAGVFQLDVGEIRSSFLASESQATRIRRFREDRLSQIAADETPATLAPGKRMVLHTIPIASFLNNARITLPNERFLLNAFPPIMINATDWRHNLDGFLTWRSSGAPFSENAGWGYAQVFWHGAVEAVVAGGALGGRTDDGREVIVSDIEPHVVQAVEAYLDSFRRIEVAPPIAIALSLVVCKGAVLHIAGSREIRHRYAIDREIAALPEVILDSLSVDVPQTLKPIFDAMWNAGGYPGSPNYDKVGNWAPRR